MSVCSQISLSAVALSRQWEYPIFKRMDGLVEVNSYRETPAVVSDALFMVIQS